MIDAELVPEYGPQGLSVATVYCGEEPGFGHIVDRHSDLSFPMVWDLEFEVFDRYRVPGMVFPLSVVLDRDGNVLYKDNLEEIDGVEAAIQDALAK